MVQQGEIPATNEIHTFFHCGLCLAELPNDQSPRKYASLEVGFTHLGLHVWCKRHEDNVIHIDFDGHKFHANKSAGKAPDPEAIMRRFFVGPEGGGN